MSEWIDAMNGQAGNLDHSDEVVLTFDVPDEALEASASAIPGAAFSFQNAPTVSVIFVCCGNDIGGGAP